MKDFLFLTICSLRYDVAKYAMDAGMTPFLQRTIKSWEHRECSATFTLPSHVAFFSGRTPRPLAKQLVDGHDTDERMFALSTRWERYQGRNIRYFFEDAPNVPRGFESKGYKTIGVGGVGWFNTNFASSRLWKNHYFQDFLFQDEYGNGFPTAFALQISDLKEKLVGRGDEPHFLFINASACHVPYIHGIKNQTLAERQAESLKYIDSQLADLLNLLKPGSTVLICADHGDCQGEDNLFGHGFFHENIMRVPYAEFTV